MEVSSKIIHHEIERREYEKLKQEIEYAFKRKYLSNDETSNASNFKYFKGKSESEIESNLEGLSIRETFVKAIENNVPSVIKKCLTLGASVVDDADVFVCEYITKKSYNKFEFRDLNISHMTNTIKESINRYLDILYKKNISFLIEYTGECDANTNIKIGKSSILVTFCIKSCIHMGYNKYFQYQMSFQ